MPIKEKEPAGRLQLKEKIIVKKFASETATEPYEISTSEVSDDATRVDKSR